jgi:hypothetical protein
MTSHANSSEIVARLGTLALIGMAAFLFACVAAQFLRTDLDWMRVPNSFYLIGPYGWMVRAGYFAMSFALILFAAAGYLALRHAARSAAPLLLFVVGAMALSVTAIERTAVDGQPLRLENYVHGVAAQTAFLCTVTAMLLQAWRLRGDARWRRWFRPGFLYAMACFVLLWVQALWRDLPRGLSQKLLIVLILSGLMIAAYRLRRGPDGAE